VEEVEEEEVCDFFL
jgi:hypothetical protein